MFKINWDYYLSPLRMRTSNKIEDSRNDFESDFGRVAFSPALRRMHDKTQVIPLTNGDCVHTRLTHSIEVMNIAHSLGIYICRSEDFVDTYGEIEALKLENKICPILRTAAIVHDIGNPPFGHFGEMVIQSYFKDETKSTELGKANIDYSCFDGNAQGLRILTRLAYADDLQGLNLTFATLGAYLKYPNSGSPYSKNDKEDEKEISAKRKSYIGKKKHGVFITEEEILNNVIKECHLNENGHIKRHPLSFLVEAADSICYYVMDLEDALKLNWLTIENAICAITDYVCEKTGKKDFNLYKLLDLDSESFDNCSNSLKRIKFRVALINYLVKLAKDRFLQNLELIDKGNYSKELIEDDENQIALALGNLTKEYILCNPLVERAEITGKAVLNGLMDILFEFMNNNDMKYYNKLKSILSKSAMKVMIHTNNEDHPKTLIITDKNIRDFNLYDLSYEDKARIIVDFISGMTDSFAVDLYQRLSGMKLS